MAKIAGFLDAAPYPLCSYMAYLELSRPKYARVRGTFFSWNCRECKWDNNCQYPSKHQSIIKAQTEVLG